MRTQYFMISEVDIRDGKSKEKAEWVKRSKTVRSKKLRCEGGGERGGRQGVERKKLKSLLN